MSISMLSFSILQFTVSVITTVMASFLVFSMISPVHFPKNNHLAATSKTLLLSFLLTINVSLTAFLIVSELSLPTLLLFSIGIFIALFLSVQGLKYYSRYQFTRPYSFVKNGALFSLIVTTLFFAGYSLLLDTVEIHPIKLAVSILFILGFCFPFFRYIAQCKRDARTNPSRKQFMMWSVVNGLSFSLLPLLTLLSVVPNEEVAYSFLITNQIGTVLPFFTQLCFMMIAWFIPDVLSEERLQLQFQQLKEREIWYHSLFEHNPVAAITFDNRGNIKQTNAKIFELTGYEQDYVVEKSFKPYVYKADHRIIYKEFKKALIGVGNEFELRLLHKDGRMIQTMVAMVPVFIQQRVVGVHCLVTDVTQAKEAEKKIHHMAYHDDLTGLPNRRYFEKTTSDLIQNHLGKLAILLLDLNRFKVVNDTLGHACGDQMLVEISNRMIGNVGPHDVVARMSGDEFIVLLTSIRGKADVTRITNKIHESLEHPIIINGHEIITSTSIGVAMYPDHGKDLTTLLKSADVAMYTAKKKGAAQTFFYSNSLHAKETNPIQLEEDIRSAIKHEDFLIYYQPKFSTINGRMIGVEALVRWKHRHKGIISPGHFIPLAEETGLIIPLGAHVLRKVCLKLKEWESRGQKDIIVSVNVSSRQFHDDHFLQTVRNILIETGVNPRQIELEITESTAMEQVYRAERILKELSELGITITIDDFGIEYSSLNYLKKFAVDTLKVDKSFIHELLTNESNQAIVRAIIAMATHLQLDLVAEGVETEEQLKWLQMNGCQYVQGYYFSRPIPCEEFEKQFLTLYNLASS
ncbi:EAL and GGDEF domain-containing protein [Bacillus coahuilensis]|uniref:sensor domain-containing protein n=1 Tax=Bacillus coahuilensis TaxID=408580 RepID=UPI0007517107|nr:EAL domain-containing protein [Bacillus coahuilensis]